MVEPKHPKVIDTFEGKNKFTNEDKCWPDLRKVGANTDFFCLIEELHSQTRVKLVNLLPV